MLNILSETVDKNRKNREDWIGKTKNIEKKPVASGFAATSNQHMNHFSGRAVHGRHIRCPVRQVGLTPDELLEQLRDLAGPRRN